MDARYSTKKIKALLDEMKEISSSDFILFNSDGSIISQTFTPDEAIRNSAAAFADSSADNQIYGKTVFHRIDAPENEEYVLACTSDANLSGALIIGKMAVSQIRNFMLSSITASDKSSIIKDFLNDEISSEKFAEKTRQMNLRNNEYIIYMIGFEKAYDSSVMDTFRYMFVDRRNDFLIELDDKAAVLIKDRNGLKYEAAGSFAHTIVDSMQMEAMENVYVGYCEEAFVLSSIKQPYLKASSALKIGISFFTGTRVFSYEHLGLGRLINELSEEACLMYIKENFGTIERLDLDDEFVVTINVLFNNNLNIAETARQLYIHRNTLVYRLEKINEKLGLDIRNFDDAMKYRIALMIKIRLSEAASK